MKPEEQLWLNTLVRGLCDSVGLTHPNFDISEWKIIKEASTISDRYKMGNKQSLLLESLMS